MISARTGYEEMTVNAPPAARSDRTHSLSATCIGVLGKDRRGFVLLTNPPKAISEFNNGDVLDVTGPLCPAIAETATDSRLTVSLKKTGEIATHLAKPKFQYLLLGEVLSPPTPAAGDDSTQLFRDCEFCPELVLLPGAMFAMGGNVESSEKPIHQVSVSPVFFARTPVTVSQWR
jgi:formylglycine-generating enzyme required for sulfatase activity